jgi:hypothetical protein
VDPPGYEAESSLGCLCPDVRCTSEAGGRRCPNVVKAMDPGAFKFCAAVRESTPTLFCRPWWLFGP